MLRRYNSHIILVAIILLGFALRVYRLDALPFRGDEAFTVQNWVIQPLSSALINIEIDDPDATTDRNIEPPLVVNDPHPPLAYTLYHVWGAFVGLSELAIRMLPVLANTVGIAAMYALGKRIWGKRVGLLAALLWAIHPFEIWHAQDARNYGIWPAMSVTAIWLAVRALTINRPRDWVLYVIAGLIAIYTYYLEMFILAALNVYVLVTYIRERGTLKRWIISQAIIWGTFALWLLYFLNILRQSKMYSGTAGGFSLETLLTLFLPSLSFGQTLPADFMSGIAPILLVILILCMVYIARKNRRVAIFLGALIVVPVIAISIVSSFLPVYAPRYILGIVPAILLLITITSTELMTTKPTRWLGGLLISVWVALSLVSLNNHFHDATFYKVDEWRSVATYLDHMTQSDDLIIQTTSDAGFGYYYQQTGNPTDEMGLPFNKEHETSAIEAILAEGLATYDRYWIVARTNPEWPNRNVIENWLNTHMQRALVAAPGGIDVQLYLPWDVAPDEVPDGPSAQFEETALVHGARIFPPDSNQTITVWVYWEALQSTETPLKGFVHLVGDVNPATGGPLWAQDDQEPQDGGAATTTWQPGQIYRDIYTIDIANIPAGDYELLLGLYEQENGIRLTADAGGDALSLGTITLP
ncbi:glycosyltransferase family 39 protein [Phototrophicus methaneseepsis]|uniref:Glycosyltransferase family 39 protein n=1 Tax=Phototrophicus methaneseepsis TaxID=2710758 RepID=A0A7S8ICX2_9CHLR|nr:glycosyltransferase family 39 protein [Phototrophicus methaneseepsis]QPC80967.1 glycosyltransferase family 39 protein [Phototrophicus methaneseepsis]